MTLIYGSLLVFFLSVIIGICQAKITYETLKPTDAPKPTRRTKPSIKLEMCMLKPQRGPCRADLKMYYFNLKSRNCKRFRWGGCQGNGNRFDTESECMESCIANPNARKTRPHYCMLGYDYGYCFGSLKRYFFDRMWMVCRETIYSGCGGNENNFITMNECNRVCVFSAPAKEKKISSLLLRAQDSGSKADNDENDKGKRDYDTKN